MAKDIKDMTPQERDNHGAWVLAEACARWRPMAPMLLSIRREEILSIVMALQATITHPACPPRQEQAMSEIGHALQEAISDEPEIYALLEAGWDRGADIDPTERRD